MAPQDREPGPVPEVQGSGLERREACQEESGEVMEESAMSKAKCAIYSRVSTSRQAEEGISLDAQLARCREYAASRNMEVIGEFCDAGISGKSMKNRPSFAKALNLCCKEKATLLFYSLSRISRSTRDLLDIAERVKKAGGGLASISDQIDSSTAMGSFLFTILAALCALERELTVERVTGALHHLKSTGRVYGTTPFGFERTTDDRLVGLLSEQAVLDRIVAMRADGMSFDKVAQALNREHINGKNGGQWHASTVRQVLGRKENK